jgi:hypothetical protein
MQHDNDDEGHGSEGREPCLHCMIRETIDMYAEHMHTSTGSPVDVHHTIPVLLSNVAELLAWIGEGKERKASVKHYEGVLRNLVRHYREIGRYPGGPWTQESQH